MIGYKIDEYKFKNYELIEPFSKKGLRILRKIVFLQSLTLDPDVIELKKL